MSQFDTLVGIIFQSDQTQFMYYSTTVIAYIIMRNSVKVIF